MIPKSMIIGKNKFSITVGKYEIRCKNGEFRAYQMILHEGRIRLKLIFKTGGKNGKVLEVQMDKKNEGKPQWKTKKAKSACDA